MRRAWLVVLLGAVLGCGWLSCSDGNDTPAGPQAPGEPGERVPDLVVDSLVIRPAAPSASDSLAVSVRLANTGTAAATQAAVVLRVDGVETGRVAVDLAPGLVAVVRFALDNLAAGTHRVEVVADPAQGEANTSDNRVRRESLEVAAVPAQVRPPDLVADLPGGATMAFVRLAPGTFSMGSPETDFLADPDERPVHAVTISRGFYLATHEITQGQWVAVMGTSPWTRQASVQVDPANPAVYLSWDEVQLLPQRLNEAAGDSLYRLPSEAEWEYACRAGTTTRWSFGDDEGRLGDYAWYSANSWKAGEPYAHRAGTRLPNPWGLYDMHGNVWEWCQDWYGRYEDAAQQDPTGPVEDIDCVVRGGLFLDLAAGTRSANRGYYAPTYRSHGIGARLVRIK